MGKEQSRDNQSKPDLRKIYSPSKDTPENNISKIEDTGKPTRGTPVPPKPPTTGENKE